MMMEQNKDWFTSQIVLSSLIVVLSLFTAYVSYERSLASSAQLRKNTAGLREMMLGTSAETMANANFQNDLSNYSDAELATDDIQKTKYEVRYSEELQNAITKNVDDPFSDEYFENVFAESEQHRAEAEILFDAADGYSKRGNALQQIILITTLGLGFVAWTSVIKNERHLIRIVFIAFAFLTLTYGIYLFTQVPIVQ
jgi:hypothetical protein